MNLNQPIKLIDSHCHLHYDYLPKTEEDLIREAEKNGVEALITIGTDLDSIAIIQAISEKYPQVYHTIGVHPSDVETLSNEDLNRIEASARHPKCRAIGEIGLDTYNPENSGRKPCPLEIQLDWLKKQLDLALRLKLPVVIHSREAETELLPLLSEYARQVVSDQIPGVIHCFTGTMGFGKKCLDLGFLVSFSGILTFKKAEEVQAAARAFPLDRLMVETDSPYLAPVPFRGKKCEPFMVKNTAQKLADLKEVPFEKVAAMTTANAKRLFSL